MQTRRTSPRSSGTRAFALAWALVVLGATHDVHAEGAKNTTVRLRYAAPTSCPDEAAFARDASRRTSHMILSTANDAELVEVALITTASGFEGRLARRGSAPYVERGQSCVAVASTLALTLALSIDPDSKMDIAPMPAAAETERPAPPPAPPAPPPVVVSTAPIPEAPRPPPTKVAFALGLDAGLLMTFDEPLGGLILVFETRTRPSAVVPARLRGRLLLLGQAEPAAGREARVALGALGLDACIFEIERRPMSLRPCVGIEPGIASAESRGVARASTGQAAWLSLSARARAEIALTTNFGLALEAGALAVLLRPRFTIDPPGRTAAEARAFGAMASFGLWLSFP